jgi:outer membrane protein assembly factor BamB
MTSDEFLAELDRRRLLADRLMVKLRDLLSGYDQPYSAEELADFLVLKKHLTRDQADGILASGASAGVILFQASAADLDDDDPFGGSSIFGSRGPSTGQVPEPRHVVEETDDEFQLAPLEDTPSSPKSEVLGEEDLPILSVVPSTEGALSGWTSQTPSSILSNPETEDVSVPNAPVEQRPLTEELFTPAGPTARRATSLSRGNKKKDKDNGKDNGDKKKSKRTRRAKTWDSPLILYGGGGLILLALIGVTVWLLLSRQSGNDVLAQADAALKAGAYPQAIEQYQNFLKDFPNHPDHSNGRVRLAMTRIRQQTEGGDYPSAIKVAEEELKAVEDEPAFKDIARGELAALLPQIAQGAATSAEKANPVSDDANKFTDVANKAVALYNNGAYVPKAQRDEAKLANIQDTLDRADRRKKTQLALAQGLKAMQDAVAAGKPVDAYAAHRKLLQVHPELVGDNSLGEAIQKTTAAEQAGIKFVKEAKPAKTDDFPTPWKAALAVANRRVKPTAPPPGVSGTACIRAGSAAYGLDAASGRLLWRRHVGFGATAPPIAIGDDFIVADLVHNELMRLDGKTGHLTWRQSFGGQFGELAFTGDHGFVPTKSGRIYVIEMKSGAIMGYLKFTQPLNVAPTVDRQRTRIYVAGDQAVLYTISLTEMKCTGVNYLGHAPGSIRVPLATVMDKVALIENDGVETSHLRLMALDEKGNIGKQLADRRLTGLAASPPLVTGRGMIITTDRGEMDAFDIAIGKSNNPMSLVATREASGSEPVVRHITVHGRNVWVADTQLTKYSVMPTDNRLPVEEIENNFAGSTFDDPLRTFGDVLINVRRPKDRGGYVVAATDTKQGHPVWETDIAMPPAGAPIIDEATKSLIVGSADGYVFRFDEAALRSRVQDDAAPTEMMPATHPPLTAAIDLGQGRVAFSSDNSTNLLLYTLSQPTPAKWLQLEGPMASAATPLGPGFLVPLKLGQVFYFNSNDGTRLAAPFQPRLEPGVTLEYKPAVAVGNDGRRFVITDGRQKVYLVVLNDQPQPHLEEVKQGDVGPRPIESPLVVVGDTVLAVAGGTNLLRFKIPTMETVGETNLPAPIEAGPFPTGDGILMTTADEKLVAMSAAGQVKWQAPLAQGPLAGPPLVLPDGIILTYRKGVIEHRSLADGKAIATLNVEQPLATRATSFVGRLVVTAADGTILVVDKPEPTKL